jgi:hypothetical protein
VEQLRKEASLAGILDHLAPASQVEKREVQNAAAVNGHKRLMKPADNLAPILREQIPAHHNGGTL